MCPISEYHNQAQDMWAGGRYSDNYKGIKNRHRIIICESGNYLEVELQNGLTMKCDIEHLPIVEERIWTANKGKGKYTYYVKSRKSVIRNQDHILFHNRAFPHLIEVDHINRDGLDNRSCNIREGSGRVNANNKRMQVNNKSGVKGVYKENARAGRSERWVAQWNDEEGKKRKKAFAISLYGEDEAYRLACEHRTNNFSQ